MMLGRALRRSTTLAVLVALPLLAACGDGDGNNPPPGPTATRSQGPTATVTQPQGPTATQPQGPTATVTQPQGPTATTAPQTPTFTFTVGATVTATSGATSTATLAPATATATPTGTSAATVTPTPGTGEFRDLTNAQPATFAAHGSVNQVYVTDAAANTVLELVNSDSFVAMTGTTDVNGALILREVPIGSYRVAAGHPGPLFASPAVDVKAWDDPPDQSFYSDQVIEKGYGYLRTRDGTLLAIDVFFPAGEGPFPTVIEYSGYDPANPSGGLPAQPSSLISWTLGFAVVGVNIRGTGCSGGAFQFFEALQSTDGYDVVETIAAQPWVKGHKVGLVGLSYPGISQLFVAELQPPHLAAIAPLSVIADTGRGTLYPGGILNNGFATDWAADRKHDAMPGGQRWSQQRMDEGDQTCIDNMKLRGQTPDILQMIADNEYYNAAVADPVTPATFVHNISVPLFLAGAWQDEQVGGYVATMLDRFTGTDKRHFTLVNGTHVEPLIPAVFHRWMEFLWLYVREEVPQTPGLGQAISDAIGDMTTGVSGIPLPPDRFTGMTYEAALAAFEAEPLVRVLFESGAGSNPGYQVPAFEHSFDAWPIPTLVATPFYFADDGALVPEEVPTGDGVDSFVYDPSKSQVTSYSGGNIWAALPNYTWQPLNDGKALAYATAPLEEDTVMIGSGSVDLWVKANVTDVDLQVAITEIRPDGQEIYIQNGWLRASRRGLLEDQSSELRPVYSGLLSDVMPLSSDEFVLARVELFPFAHAFRAGSRVRISVTAPGGDRPLWKFNSPPISSEVIVDIAHSEAFPSRVVLPIVPDVDVPTALPPCPGVRGQPCRTYVELTNTPGSL